MPLRQHSGPEHDFLHLADRFRQAEEECLGNQRMADVQLADGENLGNRRYIVNGQAVSGVDDQAQIAGVMRTVLNALELFHLLGVAVCIGIRTGMQLDNGRATS